MQTFMKHFSVTIAGMTQLSQNRNQLASDKLINELRKALGQRITNTNQLSSIKVRPSMNRNHILIDFKLEFTFDTNEPISKSRIKQLTHDVNAEFEHQWLTNDGKLMFHSNEKLVATEPSLKVAY